MDATQCRMARAALQLGVRELAAAADVSPTTITRLERGDPLYSRTVDAIRSTLEAAGIEFIAENGGGAGVRIRARSPEVGHSLTKGEVETDVRLRPAVPGAASEMKK